MHNSHIRHNIHIRGKMTKIPIWFLLASDIDRVYLSQGYYYPQISISLRNVGRSAFDIFHQAEKQATVNILETTIIFTAYLISR